MSRCAIPALISIVLALAPACAGAARRDTAGTDDPPSRRAFLAGPAGRIAIDDRGRGGVPVLFVHGNGSDKTHWEAQLDHLQSSHRAVALDLRGYGKSDGREGADYTIAAMAGDIQAVADGLHLDRFVLVGHSFGGAVVNAYAGAHPERVAGVVYVDPAGDLSRIRREDLKGWLDKLKPETYDAFTVEWFGQILEGSGPGVREKVLASLMSTPREVFVAAIEDLAVYDPIPDLQRFHGPRLTVITESNQKPYSLQNLVPDLPFELMTGVSHWLMMDRPEEFNRVLDDFLARAEGTDGA